MCWQLQLSEQGGAGHGLTVTVEWTGGGCIVQNCPWESLPQIVKWTQSCLSPHSPSSSVVATTSTFFVNKPEWGMEIFWQASMAKKDFHVSMCPDLERGDPDWKRAPLETSSSCLTVFCCLLSQAATADSLFTVNLGKTKAGARCLSCDLFHSSM